MTFQQFIVLSDAHGTVDMTSHAIHGRTGIPLDIIEPGIKALESADPASRSDENDGRRIILIDPARAWGWRIVNYSYYRNLASADDKRRKDKVRISLKRKGEEKHKTGYVYFIGADDAGPVKIGFSMNPWARLEELQTGSPQKFQMLCAVKGSHADERSLHAKFASVRIQGEWFNRAPELLSHIETLRSTTTSQDVAATEQPSLSVADVAQEEAEAEEEAVKRKRVLSRLQPEGFLEFWEAYPKKVSKPDAERAWSKLRPDEALRATILRALEAQKSSTGWQEENGKFIPYPATWLNGRRWEDQVSPQKQKKKPKEFPR